MKIVYTRPVCPACHTLKAQLTATGEPFEAVTVYDIHEPTPPGPVLTRAQFRAVYPEVRGFPFVVEAEGEKPAQQPQADSIPVAAFDRLMALCESQAQRIIELEDKQPQAEAAEVPNTFKLPGESDFAWIDRITSLAPQQAEAVPKFVWGYAVRNPKEPGVPHSLAYSKVQADTQALQLYSAEIIPLVAAAPQQAEAVPPDVVRDAERLDWLLMQVSGKEFRRIGVEYSGNCQRSDVDAAIAHQKGGTT